MTLCTVDLQLLYSVPKIISQTFYSKNASYKQPGVMDYSFIDHRIKLSKYWPGIYQFHHQISNAVIDVIFLIVVVLLWN